MVDYVKRNWERGQNRGDSLRERCKWLRESWRKPDDETDKVMRGWKRDQDVYYYQRLRYYLRKLQRCESISLFSSEEVSDYG